MSAVVRTGSAVKRRNISASGPVPIRSPNLIRNSANPGSSPARAVAVARRSKIRVWASSSGPLSGTSRPGFPTRPVWHLSNPARSQNLRARLDRMCRVKWGQDFGAGGGLPRRATAFARRMERCSTRSAGISALSDESIVASAIASSPSRACRAARLAPYRAFATAECADFTNFASTGFARSGRSSATGC